MTEKQYFYQNKLFSVEDDLFYENYKRMGYFEDEEEYEIKRNNYEKTVDRLEELRECNIYLKRLNKKFKQENEQLKKVLGAILLEVRRDITNTNQTGEIKVFINPNSFDLISEVLRKYGALKDWYE